MIELSKSKVDWQRKENWYLKLEQLMKKLDHFCKKYLYFSFESKTFKQVAGNV
jgi:hypothetical protein